MAHRVRIKHIQCLNVVNSYGNFNVYQIFVQPCIDIRFYKQMVHEWQMFT
jgi:hypothetical protein